MAKPTIEVVDLAKRFGAFTAVDGVSFAVRPGEIFGFLGPNGSGKSTTIRMLCGIIRPSSGRATVAGFDISDQPERVKQVIGYMSQKFSLYLELSASENFRFFSGLYSSHRGEAAFAQRELFSLLGLEGMGDRIARDLPGGFRQRLALACAIAHRPSVLFLDEPTAGVDPIARRSFWSTIQQLARQGMTIFVTTHYMDEAEYADRISLIYDGRLIAADTPDGLKSSYPRRLFELSGLPTLETMERLSSARLPCQVAPFGNALHLSCEPGIDLPPLVDSALGGRQHRLVPIEPSLEDVFESLMPI